MAESKSTEKKIEPTAEMRQKMAENHEKMASCLRSNKPFKECKKEMRALHKDMMGKGSCPMTETGDKK